MKSFKFLLIKTKTKQKLQCGKHDKLLVILTYDHNGDVWFISIVYIWGEYF